MDNSSITLKIGARAVGVCLILTAFLSANAQHPHSSSRRDSSSSAHSTADYSALNSASARQKAQQNDLKNLERQSERLAASPQTPSGSTKQRIKPLKLDGPSSGSKINFSPTTPKVRSTATGNGRRTMHSVGRPHQ